MGKERDTMRSLAELKKQQVRLRLHSYLVDEIDALAKKFSLNRTDIIEEAIRSYISAQKEDMIYKDIETSFKELKDSEFAILEELIDELENS